MNSVRYILVLSILSLLFPSGSAVAGEETRIAVISDINGRYGTAKYHARVAAAVTHIIGLNPDLVISTGDMVAGQQPNPRLTTAELEGMWRSFHATVRQPLQQAGIPLVMTPGNHDASAYPGFELERAAYIRYHTDFPPALMPEISGHFPFHYALEHKGILLVSLDATTRGKLGNNQLPWLTKLLRSAEEYRAIVLFGHLPLQPVAIGRELDIISDPKLEALLSEGKATAYLSGHHHVYYPGHRLGMDMLSVGNLGGNERRLVGSNMTTGFSFVMLEIDNANNLSISAFTAPAFEHAIDIATLPAKIGSGVHRLTRRDLVPKSDGN